MYVAIFSCLAALAGLSGLLLLSMRLLLGSPLMTRPATTCEHARSPLGSLVGIIARDFTDYRAGTAPRTAPRARSPVARFLPTATRMAMPRTSAILCLTVFMSDPYRWTTGQHALRRVSSARVPMGATPVK